MWPYHPNLLERPVPRYTSYPTAAEFHPLQKENVLESALAAIPPHADISLYLHIPYCNEICYYCACNTGRANKAKRLQAYIDALLGEIRLMGELITSQHQVKRIAFGGGSPNAIAPHEFVRLIKALKNSFNITDSEISVELDPRDFNATWAATLSETGVTHASMGIQTFSPTVQKVIGRVQPYEKIIEAMEQLRSNGVQSINFDMMYGLPGQTGTDLSDSLKSAIGLKPDRIALFGYAHLPQKIARQRRMDTSIMANQAQRFAMSQLGYQALVQAGYQAIGFDHFALPDDPMAAAYRAGQVSRNFQGYTHDPSPYLLGMGVTAISMFPDQILQNNKNVGAWREAVGDGRLSAKLGVARTPDDTIHGQIIEDILCRGQADIGCLGGKKGYAGALAPFEELGLLKRNNGHITCSDHATPYLRSIAAVFDPYRAGVSSGFSSAI
ncbi:MAG: oxygen-independent coproporphyrinogen III oxidase [Parasphingorhabdus sp.]